MTLLLNEEMQQALAATNDESVQLVNPRTNERYVLLKWENYERIQSLFENSPLTREEQLFFLHQAGKRAGWDDAEMDVYNELDPRKKA